MSMLPTKKSIISVAIVCATMVGLPTLAAAPAQADPSRVAGDTRSLVDHYVFNLSLTDFTYVRDNRHHGAILDWSTDDCSKSPDGFREVKFDAPCRRHDFGYRNYKQHGWLTESARERIDGQFRKDLYSICAKFDGWESFKGVACRRAADTYYRIVRVAGDN